MSVAGPQITQPMLPGSFAGHPGGILVDHEIIRARAEGLLKIEPFEQKCLEPATYDFRVGERAMINTASHVIDLRAGDGLLVVEPGALGVVQTLETVTLSSRIAGRMGPKSSLMRRGLFVSVGPQIDPGFQGTLIVNLINLSPRPFALHYGDAFLSAEFHLLISEPTRVYSGPSQGRTELSHEEIEVLLAYQGPTLADLHRGFAELRDNLRDISALGRDMQRLTSLQERLLAQTAEADSRSASAVRQPAFQVPIATFAPDPYVLRRELLVLVQPAGDGFTANWYDANLYASGDNEEEALRNLKALVLDVFESLIAEPEDSLGPEPRRQLAVLHHFIERQ